MLASVKEKQPFLFTYFAGGIFCKYLIETLALAICRDSIEFLRVGQFV